MTADRHDQLVAHARHLIAQGHADDTVTVAMIASVLGVSRRAVYEYIRDGLLRAERFGRTGRRNIRVSCEEAHRFVHGSHVETG